MSSPSAAAARAEAFAQIERVYAAADTLELRRRYDGWAPDYDRQIAVTLGYNAARKGAAMLTDRLPSAARVLDAGAGTGLVGAALAAAGFGDVWGADISPKMIEQAARKGAYRRLVEADIEQALVLGTRFDAVIAIGVFTAGHASPAAIERLLAVLRPQGLLCLSLRGDSAGRPYLDLLGALARSQRLSPLAAPPPFPCFTAGRHSVGMRLLLFRLGPAFTEELL